MIKLWFKHYIYDLSIGVLFGELIKNFQTPPLVFSILTEIFDKLKYDDIIHGYEITIDPENGGYNINIDAPEQIVIVLKAKIKEILGQ